jgi:ATP-dependent exoDNAse (exonuclease V) beta subunit
VSGPQLSLFIPATGDEAARDAIRADLDDTLFVEAGAGTGKTAALVDRVVALVRSGVRMRGIGAITFTEKAAAELRYRVRAALELHAASDARCADALDELDAAAICTLHAFAQRLLTEFPVEAGLPPRIEVRDEIASAVAFDARWERFVDQMLDDPAHQDAVVLGLAAGVKFTQLRAVAEAFAGNWDLLERVPAAPPLPDVEIDGWIADLEALCKERDRCVANDDKMVARLDEFSAYAEKLRGARDTADRVELLRREQPSFRVGTVGRKGNWRGDLAELRDCIVRLADRRTHILGEVANAVIRHHAVAIAGFTRQDVEERRAAGELEFHDLLVLARLLLRDSEHGPAARQRLARRYQRLLVDEFQDTDPIQVDLAVLLASSLAEDAERSWSDASIDPGRLFFVGDPKQSIYRFRRADIATFLRARDTFVPSPLLLTRNFRTTAPVLDWINHVFDDLIRAFPGSQPEYHALEPTRAAAPAGSAVTMLGTTPHDDDPDADTLREREAQDVVAAINTAIAEQWAVLDHDTWRPARLGDICILLPARTSLGFLENALDDAAIPYRAETSSLVYGSREVRDILAVLRAIDDPTDALALVSALRSALFGCGDDDLFEFHVEHGGHWDITAPLPDTIASDHPVADAMTYLGQLHQQRSWLAPSELIERVVEARRLLELGVDAGRFRDIARRIRFVVDQARLFWEATSGTLREYLAWALRQGSEGARVVETVLPETDDDAVRIMTVHGAKGLEFPIVIVSGMTTRAAPRRTGVQVLFPPAGGCEIRLASGIQTDQFELHQPVDEQMGFHEKLRLLYVACTRARDHLVVSVHRKVRSLGDDQSLWTHAELLWHAAEGAEFSDVVATAPASRRAREVTIAAPLPRDAWQAERDAAFAGGLRRRFVAATTLARRAEVASADPEPDPGLQKDARDLELPPWNKGRYGTAIGRAVHAVLQTVDLATGAGIDEAAAAQAAAEGVLGKEATIAGLARAAIASETVRTASARSHWRETYVAIPVHGVTLEGYVDLVYRGDAGLVVVDYKTDAIGSDSDLERRMQHYRIQGAAYAWAVADAVGDPVAACVFVFLDPDGAVEVTITGDDLAAAITEVDALISLERESPSPLAPPVFAEP